MKKLLVLLVVVSITGMFGCRSGGEWAIDCDEDQGWGVDTYEGEDAVTPDVEHDARTPDVKDEATCTPNCDRRECGSDGCGGFCLNTCSAIEICDDGFCVWNGKDSEGTGDCHDGRDNDGDYLFDCEDPGCAEVCNQTECTSSHDCPSLEICQTGHCVIGCDQIHGCLSGYNCSNGQCIEICIPNCTGKSCGYDGCGGSCGSCLNGTTCSNGQCICTPNCTGKACGYDGCGGSCGNCLEGTVCNDAQLCEEIPSTEGLTVSVDFSAHIVRYTGSGKIDLGTFQAGEEILLDYSWFNANGLLLAWVFNNSSYDGRISPADDYLSANYFHQSTPPAVGTWTPSCDGEVLATSAEVQSGRAEMVTFGCPK